MHNKLNQHQKRNTMKQILLASAIVFCSAQALAGGSAQAPKGCNTANLNGNWVSYQGAVTVNPHTGICHLTVQDGATSGACSFSFPGAENLQFTGVAEVHEDCSADLTMDFAPDRPFQSTFQIQLAVDKQSFVGSWSNNFGVLGVANAVRAK
jgi:hypothetical protein